MTTLAYARVSTSKQKNERQTDALDKHGYDRLFTEKISGVKKAAHRPQLSALLDYAREGDTIVVSSFDRLGRSLLDCLNTLESLEERGIRLISLKENLDLSTPQGRFMASVLLGFAELERELIRERAAEAREAARIRGKHTGRPFVLSVDQRRQARALRESGESVADLMKAYGCSRATLYRALASG